MGFANKILQANAAGYGTATGAAPAPAPTRASGIGAGASPSNAYGTEQWGMVQQSYQQQPQQQQQQQQQQQPYQQQYGQPFQQGFQSEFQQPQQQSGYQQQQPFQWQQQQQQQYGGYRQEQHPSSGYQQAPYQEQYQPAYAYQQQAQGLHQQQGYQQIPPSGYSQGYQQQPPAPPAQQPTSGPSPQFVVDVLASCVKDQALSAWYTPATLDAIAHRLVRTDAIGALSRNWRLPLELAVDLSKIALFDVAILVDDSRSMKVQQKGERIDDLKTILQKVCEATSLFDEDGVELRALNSPTDGNHVRSEAEAGTWVSALQFKGGTPIGTQLDAKILQPLVLSPARNGALKKPVLAVIITDGAPGHEPPGTIAKVITAADEALKKTTYGRGAVAYQFAQVGNDVKAQQFLSSLDNHPTLGSLIDQIMDYEFESAQMLQTTGQHLAPEMWLMKLLLGAIDSSYDSQDEKT